MEEVEGRRNEGEGEEDGEEERRGMSGGGRIREEEMRREKEIRKELTFESTRKKVDSVGTTAVSYIVFMNANSCQN